MAKTYLDASTLVNELYNEYLGNSNISVANTGDIVSIGQELKNNVPRDNLYDTIVAKVGKSITENKEWRVKMMRIYKDSWQMGLMLESLRVRTIAATSDKSKAPSAGKYDSFTQYTPAEVVAKYYNKDAGFNLEYWLPTDQLWTAFNSLSSMSRFIESIQTSIENAMRKRMELMAKACLGNMIGLTIHKAFPEANYGSNSTLLGVNLLHLYNAKHPDAQLTSENCRENQEYLRFAVKTINNFKDRMTDTSSKFNIDGEEEQTYEEDIQLTMLSTFANDIKYNLYNANNQFDYSLMQLPGYDTVSAWQATENFDEGVISEVNVKIKDDQGQDVTIELPGVMACLYDINAIGVNCEQRKVNSFYNPDIDQTKFYNRYEGCYINKTDKNFVVFFNADAA